MKPPDDFKVEINHVEFATEILQSKRNAMGLSVDQIQQLAGAILVLDDEARRLRAYAASLLVKATSLENDAVPQPITEKIGVKIFVEGKSPSDASLIEAFLAAHYAYDKAKGGPDENLTRLKFEKAAIAMVGVYRPRGKTYG